MCRVVHSCATGVDLILQTWDRRPQQCHRAGNMRSGHGRAAGSRVCTITSVGARARTGARSSDVRLDAVASIGSDRAAAAKPSSRVGAGI
jgi:hypothetical protein